MKDKIIQIKKQLIKYIYDENIDVYIKLQTLYEFAIKQYAQKYHNYTDFEFKHISTGELLDKFIPYTCKEKQEIITIFESINIYANKGIKHFDTKIITYDKNMINKSIKYFNILIKNIFKDTDPYFNFFIIDANILNTKTYDTNIINLPSNNIKNNIKNNNSQKYIINTRTSEQETSFEILNLKENICNYPYKSIYAIIFNALQKNKIIQKDTIINEFIKEKGINVNFSKVFRFEITILSLIKNNYFDENNNLCVCSTEALDMELECAIYHINNLFNLFAALIKKDIPKINITNKKSGLKISFNNNGDINIIDYIKTNDDSLIWHSTNIIYNIDEEKDKNTLEKLLKIFFNFENFRDGQIQAICKILNNDISEITIMPTGSGKSLIFYFTSLMQPSPTIIIEPTEILIKDQIRNLKKYHNIDDCVAYYNNTNNNININHNFIYLTPKVLQNKNSIISLIPQNIDLKISNIVLDEIHTISNWSHDFRADYLMTSFNLKTFLDNSKYLGFTATANYRVIKDISQQLNIDFENIITPINLNNKNINFTFKNVTTEKEVIDNIQTIAQKIKMKNENKLIIFTKDQDISQTLKNNLSDELKFEVDIFTENDENSYQGFVEGRRSILISQTDMGIGINVPTIDIISHYGVPISKSKYVQEIGRAGRLLDQSFSFITYIDKNKLSNDEIKLLDLNTSIDDILNIIQNNNSDLAYSFKQVLGHLTHYCTMSMQINDIYNNIVSIEKNKKSHGILNFKLSDNNYKIIETCLYFLYKMGIIYNWYIISNDKNNITFDIEICDDLSINTIKKNCINYITLFGNAKETIYNIEQSETTKDIIFELQTWYYEQFLLYHREQLVNMYEFVDYYAKNTTTNTNIAKELFEYFSLTATNIEEDVLTYINKIKSNQNINDIEKNYNPLIDDYILENTNKFIMIYNNIIDDENNAYTKLIQMEKYLETNYDTLADLYIFTYELINKNVMNESRFKRILTKIEEKEITDFLKYNVIIYEKINTLKNKLKLFNLLTNKIKSETIIEYIFTNNKKDQIYYGYLSQKLNKRMENLYE